jgi:RNA recognition motif-containing protein
MADPVGEDGWLALVDEASRTASDLEQRIGVVELYKRAVFAEPWALKLWMAYCEWFWSLHTDCQTADAGWSEEEQALGQELFSLGDALDLWQQGAQATQFRLNDSHELWNRWISIELDQLPPNAPRENVRRIRQIFIDRLQTPHNGWDETAQKFSTFLTQYDEASYESTMVEMTKLAERAKNLYSLREMREQKLQRATETGDIETQRLEMRDYLDWEAKQVRIKPKKGKEASPLILCVALYERALSSTALGSDPSIWQDYIVFLGQHQQAQTPLPTILSVIQRATIHCPWSGTLWARYILTAEAERLPHSDIEAIKHAATNSNLDRDGMGSVVEVYIAWCGYLTRRASRAGASEEDVDVAEMGLHTALESVRDWGQRLHGKEYKGDPLFRIERIMIQYLTQKSSVPEARNYWKTLITTQADSYEFWQQYYLWEMTVRMPIAPPSQATEVLIQAVHRPKLDWPEKMMEIYVRHCNIYTDAETLLTALDTVQFGTKLVTARRTREAAEAAALYAQQQLIEETTTINDSPSGPSKRKRDAASEEVDENSNKRLKSVEQEVNAEATREQQLKRDRENTSVFVTNLPAAVTQTKVRQWFKGYGHINKLELKDEADKLSATALIEFRSYEDVQSALIRDGKYFAEKHVRVEAATGCTLYVTNFPPEADDQYICDLFKDHAEVFAIRWPSLKYNTHRRFCYVTFRSQAQAAAASTNVHHQTLPGGFKVIAQYSDPPAKKSREGPTAEGRELHVTGIDTTLTEGDLKEVFSKYGEVDSVRILTTKTGESKGSGFVAFEQKEGATAALALDKTKLKSRVMKVEPALPRNFKPTATSKGTSASPGADADGDSVMSPSPAPEKTHAQHAPSRTENTNRIITLMNVPDTVNDSRVRAIAEKYGAIVKVVLRPDHQGAIIEYEDVASAARATLGLENHEIVPGRRLRTGGKKDLFAQKAEVKTDRIETGQGKKPQTVGFIQPSAPVRRPGVGGRGGLGTKRGLGYSAPKSTSGSSAGAGELNGKVDENVAPKSNADFKAMFVSGGKQ